MKKKIKILIMGLPGSGKTTLSEALAPLLKAKRVNADEVRKKFNDWDFSKEGRIRQSKRMNEISNQEILKNNNVITDFICPTKLSRLEFKADYIIWMNTIKEGRFNDTNKMFEKPTSEEFNYEVKTKDAEKYKSIILKDLENFF